MFAFANKSRRFVSDQVIASSRMRGVEAKGDALLFPFQRKRLVEAGQRQTARLAAIEDGLDDVGSEERQMQLAADIGAIHLEPLGERGD